MGSVHQKDVRAFVDGQEITLKEVSWDFADNNEYSFVENGKHEWSAQLEADIACMHAFQDKLNEIRREQEQRALVVIKQIINNYLSALGDSSVPLTDEQLTERCSMVRNETEPTGVYHIAVDGHDLIGLIYKGDGTIEVTAPKELLPK